MDVENPAETSVILRRDEAQARHQRLEEELAAERREHKATRRELHAMSDIVTELWETFRLSVPSHPPPGTATETLLTVTPTLLNVVNPPDVPRTTLLSPSDILAHQEKSNLPSEHLQILEMSQETKEAMANLLRSAVEYSDSGSSHGGDDYKIADVIHLDEDRASGVNGLPELILSQGETIWATTDNQELSGEREPVMKMTHPIPELECAIHPVEAPRHLVPDHDSSRVSVPESSNPPLTTPESSNPPLTTPESSRESQEYRCGDPHHDEESHPDPPDIEMDMEMSSRASSIQRDIKTADSLSDEIPGCPQAPIVDTGVRPPSISVSCANL